MRTRCSNGSSSPTCVTSSPATCPAASASCSRWLAALMADPKLIMLDEPMAGVNPALKQSLLGHIKELRDEGRTVLFVEHDMDMVHEISDWVLVMAQGQLIAEGTAEQISGTQAVIDAYLGAHHDVDLGAMTDEQAVEELGLVRTGRPRPPARASVRAGRRCGGSFSLGAGRRRHRYRRRGEHMTDGATSSKPVDLVAGYVPEVNILNGCDLYVAPGEFVGIIGPNGAGKSTLLKAMLGLVSIRSGSVFLHGDEITGQRPAQTRAARRRIRPADEQRLLDDDGQGEPRDGLLPPAEAVQGALRGRHGLFPRLAERVRPEDRIAVGWRAPDGGDGPSVDVRPDAAPARRTVRRLVADVAGRGVPALQVDQRHGCGDPDGRAERAVERCRCATAATCSTRDATRTPVPGRELLTDPKVIELYLGTLART